MDRPEFFGRFHIIAIVVALLVPFLFSSHYPPLDASGDSLRLLVLQPGSGWDEITCHLESKHFLANPVYDALSYTWGDQDTREWIRVNGAYVEVQGNLWSALHHIRDRAHPKTLWVDAICINQEDIKEKNRQIPLMAFIYRRARRVLVWLGHHQTPPESQIRSWLSHLIHEEYWKRAWIIQEIGMASSIQVLSGRAPLPWDEFVALLKKHFPVAISDIAVQRIFRLEGLRQSRYKDGQTYSLSSLLDTFRDCFSAVKHDKIYAFLGMANNHFNNSIPVDYRRSLSELYQDVIRFQNLSSSDPIHSKVEMMYYSGLIRRLLVRSPRRILRRKKPFTVRSQGWLEWYAVGLEENAGKVKMDDIMSEMQPFLWLDFVASIGKWAMVIFKSIFQQPQMEHVMFWEPSEPEIMELWLPRTQSLEIARGLRVRGAVAGQIQHIGPTCADVLASFNAEKQWSASVVDHFSDGADRRSASAQNERLKTILGASFEPRLRNIVALDPAKQFTTSPQQSPRLFIGADAMLGLVPPEARVGDLICQFWNSSSSAVLRANRDGSYDIVGRAGIVKSGENLEWDVPIDKQMFIDEAGTGVDLKMDIVTLTRLSLDVVNLPASPEARQYTRQNAANRSGFPFDPESDNGSIITLCLGLFLLLLALYFLTTRCEKLAVPLIWIIRTSTRRRRADTFNS
jgi:hypothetical protein